MQEEYIQKQAQWALQSSKSCETCYWNWVIEDTLNASEGEIDLTGDFCFGCDSFCNWKELKQAKRKQQPSS